MTDRVRTQTRVLAALIVPFLVTAFVVLYFYPARTGELFAWRIAAHMTSFLLASAYIGGAFFFTRAAFERRWHRIAVGFPPVATFATLMLVATLLHWTAFKHGSIAFTAWVVLYATTPVLVPTVWLLNRRQDDGVPKEGVVTVPRAVRAVGLLVGLILVVEALALFVAPRAIAEIWPWPLTELTARANGAMFALTGVFGIMLALDRRWTTYRVAFMSLAVALVFILVGVARAWNEFDTGRVSTWIFVIGMAALSLSVVSVYVVLESRRHRLALGPDQVARSSA